MWVRGLNVEVRSLRANGEMGTYHSLQVTARQASAGKAALCHSWEVVSNFRTWEVVTVKPGAMAVTEVSSAYRVAVSISRATGLPTAADRTPADTYALGTRTPEST